MKRWGITFLRLICLWWIGCQAWAQSPRVVTVNRTNLQVTLDGFWISNRLAMLASLSLDTSINGGSPNGSGALVHYSQLTGVPSDLVDGDAGGGSFAANTVWAGPTSGGSAAATARALVDADIPNTITIDLATTATTALAGDSATAFFTLGQIERARGGTGADTSGYGAGLLGSDGSNNTVDVDTEGELETALGGLDVVSITADDISSANLRTAVSDETGTGALVFAGGNIGAATATSPTAGDDSTKVATTEWVKDEIASSGSSGGYYTLTGGSILSANPLDSTTYYTGGINGLSLTTSSDAAEIFVPASGTIVAYSVSVRVAGTTGSSENVSHFLRLNDATDIGSTDMPWNAGWKRFLTTGLNQSVTAGDEIQLKLVTPVFATNPTTVYVYCYILIQI